MYVLLQVLLVLVQVFFTSTIVGLTFLQAAAEIRIVDPISSWWLLGADLSASFDVTYTVTGSAANALNLPEKKETDEPDVQSISVFLDGAILTSIEAPEIGKSCLHLKYRFPF